MEKKETNYGYLLFLAIIAALGGFLFGYDTAVISGTIPLVVGQYGLDTMSQGWYVGCALVGSIIGVLCAGILSDGIGRKWSMLLSAVLFTTSAVGCAVCHSFDQLVVYRIIGGMGIGVVSIVSPLYISEISIPKYRGRMVALYQLAVTIGFLGAYLINFALLRWSSSDPSLSGDWMQLIFSTEVWRGMPVPEVLLSGHHANIAKWTREESLCFTLQHRPDLIKIADSSGLLTPADYRWLAAAGWKKQ